jgi:antitoxin component YwqK of YwqJK toxin-antitoxin module
MITRNSLTVLLTACCCVAGCHNPKPKVTHGGNINPPDEVSQPGTIEVRETPYLTTETVATRSEGYVDTDGEFVFHGKVEQFWENEQQKSEDYYVHGIRNGKRTAWYDDGLMWSTGEMVDGREDGLWISWYRNGKKAKVSHFKKGAWHGLYTYWHPNGEKRSEVEFVMGKRQGKYFEWDEFGTLVKQFDYVDDVEQP